MKLNETKVLGLPWKKDKDLLAVEIPSEIQKLTKLTVLQKVASIYDPLGIISPPTIIGKIIYCDICGSRISWDKTLPDWTVKKWDK